MSNDPATPSISLNPIALTPVESSQLAAIGYDHVTQTLAIQFKAKERLGEIEGPVYHYAGCTPEMYADFEKSESKGSFFYQHIRDEKTKFPAQGTPK